MDEPPQIKAKDTEIAARLMCAQPFHAAYAAGSDAMEVKP